MGKTIAAKNEARKICLLRFHGHLLLGAVSLEAYSRRLIGKSQAFSVGTPFQGRLLGI